MSFKVGDVVDIITTKETTRTGQTGVISTICRPTELYHCRVKFPDELPNDSHELFYFSDLALCKNRIVQEIIKDL